MKSTAKTTHFPRLSADFRWGSWTLLNFCWLLWATGRASGLQRFSFGGFRGTWRPGQD